MTVLKITQIKGMVTLMAISIEMLSGLTLLVMIGIRVVGFGVVNNNGMSFTIAF